MNKNNLKDYSFSSRMAACNFLQQAGLREESPDRWVGKQATARITVEGGKIKVTMRKRHEANRRV